MGLGEKIATGLIAIGLATTLLLPERQTARVLQVGFGGLNTAFRTAMGR